MAASQWVPWRADGTENDVRNDRGAGRSTEDSGRVHRPLADAGVETGKTVSGNTATERVERSELTADRLRNVPETTSRYPDEAVIEARLHDGHLVRRVLTDGASERLRETMSYAFLTGRSQLRTTSRRCGIRCSLCRKQAFGAVNKKAEPLDVPEIPLRSGVR